MYTKGQGTVECDLVLRFAAVGFPDTPIEGFWASTPVRIDPNTAWSTSFTDGYSIIYATDELH